MQRFQHYLRYIVKKIKGREKISKKQTKINQEIWFNNFKVKIFSADQLNYSSLSKSEKLLICCLLDLFSFKHSVGFTNSLLKNELGKNKQGKFVSFLGPLGSGKSTIANILLKDLRADFVTREPYINNPFWKNSQTDPSFMFRSQIYFLLSNIISDIGARLNYGRSVSDTSALTDSLMWVEWYRQTRHLNNSEYKLYQEVLELLKDIIPRPDLLVALIPINLDRLKQGIINRQKLEPIRAGELIFTSAENKDLAQQTKIVEKLIQTMFDRWQIPVLAVQVDPLEIYRKPAINYDYIYQIRNKLGLLGELLIPKPENVVNAIRNILAEGVKGQIVIVHAKSMFTGKTSVLCQFAEKVGSRKIIAFQPRAAVRWEKQEIAIVSRDGTQVKAKIIEDNNLRSVLKQIEQKRISSHKKPYLLIDEIMLFTTQAEENDVIKVLEKIRRKGFQIIVDGIDYTFQEEPFTFMHRLLNEAKKNKKNWHALEMSTRCRYCDKVAIGTRRIKQGRLANYHDSVYLPGDQEAYEPVCCQEHKSCTGQPSDFLRKELPI